MTRLMLVFAMVLLTGCGLFQTGPNDAVKEELARRTYPAHAPHGPDLDIVLTRDGQRLYLANRTPQPYRNMSLWLNQEYVSDIRSIDIGSRNTLSLKQFINQYEESFPEAAFLAPERAFPVVLAELYDASADVRYRLVVQPRLDKDLREVFTSPLTSQ